MYQPSHLYTVVSHTNEPEGYKSFKQDFKQVFCFLLILQNSALKLALNKSLFTTDSN